MTDAILETAPKKGETSEQFKARIEETRRELDRQQAAMPASAPASVPAQNSTSGTAEQVSASRAVAQASGEPPASATRGVLPEVDDWWSKKGFKTPDDIASSYRELERELTRKNLELASKNAAPAAPTAPPVPNYWQNPTPTWMPPQPPMPVPPPAYVPMPPTQQIEQLAEQYGFLPEDFKKVYAVANDLSKVTVQNELNRVLPGVVNQVRQVNAEVTRQREMVDLMSEPTWKNPQVQFEMHKVLNEDPSIIQRQPLPYRYAHDEALKRIARDNLGGSNSFMTAPTGNSPASTGNRPPTVAGSNGKGVDVPVSGQGKQEISGDQFAALSLDDKRKFLQGLGVVGR